MHYKIETKNVHLHYGDFHALKGISTRIPEKSVTALIGPSGCGKSTFLRLFNRMNDLIDGIKITGEVLIDHQNIYKIKSVEVDRLRRNVGMVFQKPNPFPKSIFENVAYGLRVNGITDQKQIQDQVHSAGQYTASPTQRYSHDPEEASRLLQRSGLHVRQSERFSCINLHCPMNRPRNLKPRSKYYSKPTR